MLSSVKKINLKKDFGSMNFKKSTDELMREVDEGDGK